MESTFTSKKQKAKISKLVSDLDSLNETFRADKELYEAKKQTLQSEIKKYTDKNNWDKINIDIGNFNYQATPVINKKITWDLDKLSKKLDKELLNEITDKEYSINDFNGLVKYLKSCGVDPKKFKKFIDVKKSVNNKKVDELSQMGEISIDDLTGCYELQANFSYVKITKQELEL